MAALGTAAPPVIVLVGRPNVGKSHLFNRLLGRRAALVHAKPGMTLDYLRERYTPPGARPMWLTDTGGQQGETDQWSPIITQQAAIASETADLFLLVTDFQTGLMAGDKELAQHLRRRRIPWLVLANKAEHAPAPDIAAAEFYALGAARVMAVSAKKGDGLAALEQHIATRYPAATEDTAPPPAPPLKIAIVGRPNVGKSTLANRLLGEHRLAVSSTPGTTRDSVHCELPQAGGAVTLIDTAGMRRRRADLERDKLGIAATRRALAAADCALLVIDLAEGLTHQDKRIAALIEQSGCPLVLAANKADTVPSADRQTRLRRAAAALPPPPPATVILSATAARPPPARRLLTALRAAAAAAHTRFSTPQLNTALAAITTARSPRQCGRIRPKLRYAHQGGTRPPRIVIHGNATDRIDDSYRRYLATAFARHLAVDGARIRIEFRSDDNPYAPPK